MSNLLIRVGQKGSVLQKSSLHSRITQRGIVEQLFPLRFGTKKRLTKKSVRKHKKYSS